MRWLITAIGTALGITRTATLACQTQDGQTGGSNNTVEQPQPVIKESKRKRSPVRQATKGQSPKAKTSCVRTPTKKSSTSGTQPATPVRPSAKQKPKQSKKVAPKATQGKSPKLVKKAAPKTSGQKQR